MGALRIAVVKMRTHDAKRQILLNALIELGAPEPLAQSLLSGDEQSAAKERPDGRPGDQKPLRVANVCRQFRAWKRSKLPRYNVANKRNVFLSESRFLTRPVRHAP